MKYKYIFFSIIFFLLFSIFGFPESASAKENNSDNPPKIDWSDLDEGEHRIFGSEKAEKFPINAFIVELEKWQNHYSLMLLGLFRYTNYPKYKSLRILPFWYRLDSKIDNRQRTFIPILLLYNRIDGYTNFTISPLYLSDLSKYENNRSLLYLIWWGNSNSSYSKSSYFLSPILFYRNTFYKDSEYEKTIVINPFYYWYKKRGRKSEEEQESTWWFPLIPIVYNHTSGSGGHRNFFWLLDYSWEKNRGIDKLKRFWLTPVFYWKRGEPGYTYVVPPIYIHNRYANGQYWQHLLPFYFSSRKIKFQYDAQGRNSKKVYNDKKLIALYYESSSFIKEESRAEYLKGTTWWFPVFYSHFEKNWGIHRNFLFLFDWHTSKDGRLERFWLLPLYFSKKGSYRHVAPLFVSFQDRSLFFSSSGSLYYSERSSFSTLFWYYSNKREFTTDKFSKNLLTNDEKQNKVKSYPSIKNQIENLKDHYRTRTLASLLFYSNQKIKDPYTEKARVVSNRLWIPLIPLVYSSHLEHNGDISRNFFLIFDWKKNKNNRIIRSWFLPFWYYTAKLRDKINPEENHRTFTLLWYYNNYTLQNTLKKETGEVKIKSKRKTLLTLFNYYTEENFYRDDKLEASFSRLYIPFIPIFYASRASSETGTSGNLFIFFEWDKDPKGNWKSFWIMPFVFHSFEKSGYRIYPPFYFRPSGWTEEKGVSFGAFPIHYHWWYKDKETLWSWLIHYKKKDPANKKDINIWAPFYFKWNYSNWKSTLILPWSLEFEDDKRYVKIYVFGLSKTVALGINPKADIALGRNEKGFYFDMEWSLLYDFFSIASRITIPWKKRDKQSPNIHLSTKKLNILRIGDAQIKIKEDKKTKPDDIKVKKQDSKFRKDTSISRENSIYFWGFKFLYGLTAFEIADTKRHFRLLPLTWISWDKDSDNKVNWFLNYLSYKEGDQSYFVFFPLYGSQYIGKSYMKNYLLIAYMDEWDANKKYRERTLIWPFINWYSSPEKSGFRFFPIIWYKNYIEKKIQVSKIYSLLYYSHYRENLITKKAIYDFSISPLFYSKSKKSDSSYSKTWFFPIIPIVYYSKHKNTYRENGKSVEDFLLVGLPLLYINSYSTSRQDSIPGSLPKESKGTNNSKKDLITDFSYTFFLLGFKYFNSTSYSSKSFLFGLIEKTNHKTEKYSEFKLFYGLIRHTSSFNKSESRFLPVYYYYDYKRNFEFSLLLGLYKNFKEPSYLPDRKLSNSSHKFFWGLIYTSKEYMDVYRYFGRKSLNFPAGVRTFWLIPLYYYSNYENLEKTKGKSKYLDILHISLLWYKNYELLEGEDSQKESHFASTFWFPIIPIFYNYSEPGIRHVNIFGIIDWKKDEKRNYFRFWFFPLYMTWNYPNKWSKFILGLYLHESPNYSRQNFLYLADHRRYHNEQNNRHNYNRLSFLLGTVDYYSSEKIKEFKLFYGLLMSYKGYNKSDKYDFDILWFLYKREKTGYSYYHGLFSIYHYWEYNSGSWTFFSPVTLTYLKHTKYGKLDMVGLGLLWYRNYKPYQKYERQMLLLGIPYYKKKFPERGFEQIGSLWGLLWYYETETEKDYSKFSILKFLYSRTTINGKVYHNILGFTL